MKRAPPTKKGRKLPPPRKKAPPPRKAADRLGPPLAPFLRADDPEPEPSTPGAPEPEDDEQISTDLWTEAMTVIQQIEADPRAQKAKTQLVLAREIIERDGLRLVDQLRRSVDLGYHANPGTRWFVRELVTFGREVLGR